MKKKLPIPFSILFRNAIGFSLTEVLIAMGLAGGLAVFMMKLFEQSAKQQSTISQRADFESLVTTVKMIVERQCDVNFNTSEFNKSGVLVAKRKKIYQAPYDGPLLNGEPTQSLHKKQLILDTDEPFDGLKVSPFEIEVHPDQLGSTKPVLGYLIVSAEKDKGSNSRKSFGAKKMIKKIPISLTIDGFNKITSCQRGASQDQIPRGAVMAFNLKDGCPDGWILSDGNNGTYDLRGRNIIGTGKNLTSGATDFKLGDSKGEEKHELLLNELTKHRHGYTYVEKPTDHKKGTNDDKDKLYLDFDYAKNPFTDFEGNSDPFNVLDPYVSLTYCQKI